MMNNYTISVEEIIDSIWMDGHPEETTSAFTIPSYKNALSNIDKKIEYALPYIFSFDFPCYGEESDKIKLEKHILTDYYTRNICCDSFARWLLYLKGRMDDIMPRYTALYNAQAKLLASEVLEPMKIEEARTNKVSNKKDRETTSTSSTQAKGIAESNSSNQKLNSGYDNTDTTDENRFSNMPQAMINAENDYLTNLTKNYNAEKNNYKDETTTSDSDKSQSESSESGTSNYQELQNALKNENYSKIMRGNLGRFSNGKLVKEYEDVIINIEQAIVKDLNDLFYLIY